MNSTIWVVIKQYWDRVEKTFKVIYYASKTFNEAQENYSTTEKEMLAMVFACEKFRSYILSPHPPPPPPPPPSPPPPPPPQCTCNVHLDTFTYISTFQWNDAKLMECYMPCSKSIPTPLLNVMTKSNIFRVNH